MVFGTIWWLVTWPFRVLFGLVEWLGRLAAFGLGFAMMVVGVALWAGPLYLIGIPLFVAGLLITLRALD